MTRQQKPEAYRTAHGMYLEVLRASGQINMFAAGFHLATAFDLPKRAAREIVQYWAASVDDSPFHAGIATTVPPDRDDPGVTDLPAAMRQHEDTR